MTKRFFVAVLAVLTVLTLCASACAKRPNEPLQVDTQAPTEPTAAPTEAATAEAAPSGAVAEPGTQAPMETSSSDELDGRSYYELYLFYNGLRSELCAEINEKLGENNALIEAREPENFASQPAYVNDLPLILFESAELDQHVQFCESPEKASVEECYADYGYENVEFTELGPSSWQVVYSDENESGSITEYTDVFVKNGASIRCEKLTDGVSSDFFEFVSLGCDRYALENATCRAVVTYSSGRIVDFVCSETRFENDWDTWQPTSWSVSYDASADSIFNRAELGRDWVLEKDASGGLLRAFELGTDGSFTYSGYTKTGFGEDAGFEPFEPVVMPCE